MPLSGGPCLYPPGRWDGQRKQKVGLDGLSEPFAHAWRQSLCRKVMTHVGARTAQTGLRICLDRTYYYVSSVLLKSRAYGLAAIPTAPVAYVLHYQAKQRKQGALNVLRI